MQRFRHHPLLNTKGNDIISDFSAVLMLVYVFIGCQGIQLLFSAVYRFLRKAEGIIFSAPHFYKNQLPFFCCNDVNLCPSMSPVGLPNDISFLHQPLPGISLAGRPGLLFYRFHGLRIMAIVSRLTQTSFCCSS